MKKSDLENFASDIVGKRVQILKPEDNSKFATYKNNFSEIEPEQKYGVYFDGLIVYDFKTGKTEDNFYKSFVTQFINKCAIKQQQFIDGEIRTPSKDEVVYRLKSRSNKVKKYYFYTTLYGIGYFCFFMQKDVFEDTNNKVGKYLKSKGIKFTNEFSEAGWVYRFVIKESQEKHNDLLENFEI